MKIPLFVAITVSGLISSPRAEPSLLEKRKDHCTVLVDEKKDEELPPEPPAGIFDLIKYPAKVGELSAYLSRPKSKDEPGPAIIWLTGGFPVSNSGANLWDETSISNEQSARIYRIKGINMMFPHLRGRSGNPGLIENFYGEVDDVVSAYEFLGQQKHIDPKRIYLGGHSTGGTLALLVAAATDKFAGIISLGPVATHYGKDKANYQWNEKERELRAPVLHLASIKSPTYIMEGEDGNYESLMKLKNANKNPLVKITQVDDATHFTIVHPVNLMVAEAILKSEDGGLDLSLPALKSSYSQLRREQREAEDLRVLADLRGDGVMITNPQTLVFYAYSDKKLPSATRGKLAGKGFSFLKSVEIKEDNDTAYFLHRFTRQITPSNLDKLWEASADAEAICNSGDLEYGSWSIEQ